MLTGWLDRVLVRGVAWELTEGSHGITGQLTNVRRLVTITTHGSSKFAQHDGRREPDDG